MKMGRCNDGKYFITFTRKSRVYTVDASITSRGNCITNVDKHNIKARNYKYSMLYVEVPFRIRCLV